MLLVHREVRIHCIHNYTTRTKELKYRPAGVYA